FLLVLLCWTFCDCSVNRNPQESERYIIESERQWAESVASGDTGPVERILANNFVGVDPNGNLYDKAKMISDTREAPKFFISNRLNLVKSGSTVIRQLRKAANLGSEGRVNVGVLFGPTPGSVAVGDGRL